MMELDVSYHEDLIEEKNKDAKYEDTVARK